MSFKQHFPSTHSIHSSYSESRQFEFQPRFSVPWSK